MGDRTTVYLEIGGKINKEAVTDLLKIIQLEDGVGHDDQYDFVDLEKLSKEDITTIREFVFEECNYANIENVEAVLIKHKIPYIQSWDQGSSYESGTIMNLFDEFGREETTGRQEPSVPYEYIRRCSKDPSQLIYLLQLAEWWAKPLPELEIID